MARFDPRPPGAPPRRPADRRRRRRRRRLGLTVAAAAPLLMGAAGCGRRDLETRKADARERQQVSRVGEHQPWRPLTEPEKIEKLLEEVRASDLTFIRHGREMTARETATRLRRRYERHGDKVNTARDFAGRFAASGPLSGKPYLVRLDNGTEVLARDWMLERLAEIEAPPGRFVERLGDPVAEAPRTGPKVAPEAEPEPPSVEGAIDLIEQSALEFAAPRNGADPIVYSGRQMARMLRNKSTWLGSDLTEVQPWIDGVASRAYGSYELYQVRHPDGRREPLPGWLREQLGLAPPGDQSHDPAIAASAAIPPDPPPPADPSGATP